MARWHYSLFSVSRDRIGTNDNNDAFSDLPQHLTSLLVHIPGSISNHTFAKHVAAGSTVPTIAAEKSVGRANMRELSRVLPESCR